MPFLYPALRRARKLALLGFHRKPESDHIEDVGAL